MKRLREKRSAFRKECLISLEPAVPSNYGFIQQNKQLLCPVESQGWGQTQGQTLHHHSMANTAL